MSGGKTTLFLDYIATGKLIPEKMAEIVSGVSEGCIQAGLALIGGETAEMPGMYGEGDYDLAGFAVGVVDKSEIITGDEIEAGDIAIALSSSGVHSNGFSLVRAIIEKSALKYSDPYKDSGLSIGEKLLTPTRIYAKSVQVLKNKLKLKGLSHITGGGVFENFPRVLPKNLGLEISANGFERDDIFEFLQNLLDIETEEMFSTFNMGIGMVIFVKQEDKDIALETLALSGENAFVLGEVSAEFSGVRLV